MFRKINPRIRVLLLTLIALGALCLLWGFCIEPELLTVTETAYTDARLPAELDGLRLVFVSDIHAGPYYPPDRVERLVKKINEMNPDIVLFGGDLLQHEKESLWMDSARVSRAFAAMQPHLGKFAVLGNHDISTGITREIAENILKDGGFTLLENSAVEVQKGFFVAGTQPWPMPGDKTAPVLSDVSKVAYTTQNNAFSLLLSHEPAQIGENAKYPFALQLSGHTHGGQVALPIFGPLVLPDGSTIYKGGAYRVENTPLFVSRGIGTSVIRVRLFVPPEIVVITLHSK